MDNLRLWILGIGALVLIGMYVWGHYQETRTLRSQRAEQSRRFRGRAEHHAYDDDAVDVAPMHALRDDDEFIEATSDRTSPSEQNAVPEMILTLSILAGAGRRMEGALLLPAFARAGLVYGDKKIFHAPADLENTEGPVLFSVANLVEPGTLEPEKLKHLTTPGLFLFARLPGPVNGVEIYDHMVATARFLASELRGEVCDSKREPLNAEMQEDTRVAILTTIGNAVSRPII